MWGGLGEVRGEYDQDTLSKIIKEFKRCISKKKVY